MAESAIDSAPRHEFETSGRACPGANYKAAAPERSIARWLLLSRYLTVTFKSRALVLRDGSSSLLSSRPLPFRSLREPLRSQRNLGLPSAQHEGSVGVRTCTLFEMASRTMLKSDKSGPAAGPCRRFRAGNARPKRARISRPR